MIGVSGPDERDREDERQQPEPGESAQPEAVLAREIALSGSRGPVFGPLTFDVGAGDLAAVIGAQGSGRTSVLLCSTARMKIDHGVLFVLGEEMPRHLSRTQSHTALANFAQIDTLDEGLTVAEVCTERLGLLTPLWRRIPRMDADEVTIRLSPAFGDRPVPGPRTKIWELSGLDLVCLRIGLALMGAPRLLAVDDVDVALPDPDDQARLWQILDSLRGPDLTIIAAAASELSLPPQAVRIPLQPDPLQPDQSQGA